MLIIADAAVICGGFFLAVSMACDLVDWILGR